MEVIKLSEIEQAIKKEIIIENGVPRWFEHKLNGSIVINEITNSEITKELNEEIIQNLKGGETQEQIAYLILPYITNIENDIPLERFINLMQSKNPIILMLYEGVMREVEDLFNYADFHEEHKETIEKISKMQSQIKEETVEEKIIRLTNEMNNEKDTKKKKTLLLELAKLYEKVDN